MRAPHVPCWGHVGSLWGPGRLTCRPLPFPRGRRWYKAYGYDFSSSNVMAQLVYRFPILLDATAREMEVKGDAMMSKWAEVMTNMRPKTYFLRPDVAIPLGFAIVKEFVDQYILRRPDFYPMGGRP